MYFIPTFTIIAVELLHFYNCVITDDDCLNSILNTDKSSFFLPAKDEPFGRQFLKYFELEPGYTNLNHGGFGASPKIVAECARYWRRRMETNPDQWFRYELKTKLDKVLKSMASYMGVADYKDLILVPNVSAGVGAILMSMNFGANDVVIYFSEAFGTVTYAINHHTRKVGARTERIEIKFPVNDGSILAMLRNALQKFKGRVRMICISHISSTPSALFPVEAMQTIARQNGALLLVDGAHALGQIGLNLDSMDPDFYVANGHKWFFSARGSAIIYVKKNLRGLFDDSSIPHYGHGSTLLEDESETYDYSNFLTMLTVVEYRRLLGESKILNYNRNLAMHAAHTLSKAWGSNLLIPDYARQNLSMINVRLPIYHYMLKYTVVERLMQQQRTFLIDFYHNGYFYVRICAQIYNDKSDYDDLAQNLLNVKRDLTPLIAQSFPCPSRRT